MHLVDDLPQIEAGLIQRLGPGYPARVTWRPDRIQKLRESRKLSQTELGDRIGLTQPKISAIETGRISKTKKPRPAKAPGTKDLTAQQRPGRPSRLDIETLYALSQVLDCDIGEIADVPGSSRADITADTIRGLKDQLLTVESVITLVSPDERTSLHDVYYPTTLQDRSGRGSTVIADSLQDLGDRAGLILGQAGQGKSFLLRHLTTQEVVHARSLPLFFELREFAGGTLNDAVHDRLRRLGLCQDAAQFTHVLSRGQVSLLFDGFDELPLPGRATFLSELSALYATYPRVKLLIASRPDSGVIACDWLHPYSVSPLQPADIEPLIRRNASDESADEVLSQLREADLQVRDLLVSPAFVAGFLRSFRRDKTTRDNTLAFYHGLFDLFVKRHNASLTGPRHPLSSGLHVDRLRDFFEALAFFLFEGHGPAEIPLTDVRRQAVRAGAVVQCEDVALLALQDVLDLSNLLTEQDGTCSFRQPAIAEVSAASFVAGRTPSDATELYRQMLARWPHWRSVLSFAADLDPVRMAALLEIPDLERLVSDGPMGYLRQFDSFVLMHADNVDDQLRIGTPTAYGARDHQLIVGSIRKGMLRQSLPQWCSGVTYPELSPGEMKAIPKNAIDFAKLADWLGTRLNDGFSRCQQRLKECRRLASTHAAR